ncbi:uncharacterized protein B0T23DRAFT_317641 [Neurospora hispaniola]|uniref:DUF7587 domain-containing protein n=1 Tax=Neurospora hispaniola TaxID=588809 RepID=A0AAJ0I6X9_9PEZI|nr:hypothetical protein B0T23DRAFT_317641 [Neurospora hispaniola]
MEDIFRPWTLAGCFMTPELFPPLLYYVRHGTSHTLFGPNGDILTKNPDKSLNISSRDEFEMLVRGHLNWQTRGPSFFISTFFNKREAWRWGLEREPMAVLYTIDTRRLPVPWPVVCAGVHTQNTLDADFLFLSHIPNQAIIRIDTVRPHLPQGLAPGDYSNPPTPPTLGFVPPPPPYVEPTPGPHVRFASPPQIASPPQYSAPQHFSSPPYTTPGRYITPVPPVEPPSQVPPVDESQARSESGSTREPETVPLPAPSSTSQPRTPPSQVIPGQIVESPPKLSPQLQKETAVSELPVPSGTEPAIAFDLEPGVEPQPELMPGQLAESPPQLSPQLQDETTVSELPVSSGTESPIASDPEPGAEPQPELGPEVDSEVTAAPEPEIPNGVPGTPNGVPGTFVQSLPIRLLQSNLGTPAGTRFGINFFATDYGETPESPRSEQAVNSNPEAPATNGIHINGVPGTPNGVAGTPNGSLPVLVVQSNPGTPPGTRFGINFFATDYSETPSPDSPLFGEAVNSNSEAFVPLTNGFHINFFAED